MWHISFYQDYYLAKSAVENNHSQGPNLRKGLDWQIKHSYIGDNHPVTLKSLMGTNLHS